MLDETFGPTDHVLIGGDWRPVSDHLPLEDPSTGGTVGQQKHGVVGAGVAIDADAVEANIRGFGQCLLQDGLASWLGGAGGLALAIGIASVAFGLVHLITPTYAVLATLVGAYLGALYVLSGSILTPIVTHALYDFVALVYLVKWKPGRSLARGNEPRADEDHLE